MIYALRFLSASAAALRCAALRRAAPRRHLDQLAPAHLDQRHEVLRDARVGQRLGDLAERLDGAVAHDRLLDLAQVFERRQQVVRVRGAADVGHKLAELLGHRQQHLVLVIVGLCQERDELRARPLLAQRERDRAQALDRVQAPNRLIVLELVAAPASQPRFDSSGRWHMRSCSGDGRGGRGCVYASREELWCSGVAHTVQQQQQQQQAVVQQAAHIRMAIGSSFSSGPEAAMMSRLL